MARYLAQSRCATGGLSRAGRGGWAGLFGCYPRDPGVPFPPHPPPQRAPGGAAPPAPTPPATPSAPATTQPTIASTPDQDNKYIQALNDRGIFAMSTRSGPGVTGRIPVNVATGRVAH